MTYIRMQRTDRAYLQCMHTYMQNVRAHVSMYTYVCMNVRMDYKCIYVQPLT